MVQVDSKAGGVSGSNRDDLRKSNLSTLLRLVYRNGSLPRTELTAQTGLNRSTISDLVSQLERLGLVKESEIVPDGKKGRPSSLVSITDDLVALSVTPLHHSTQVAAVTMQNEVIHRETVATQINPSPDQVCSAVITAVEQIKKKLTKSQKIIGVAVAISGQVDILHNSIRIFSMLRWNDVPFGEMLAARINLPVRVDNDGTIACLAESTFGAGRGFEDIIYLFGGQGGIGGGIVMGGRLIRGSRGFAGELGHLHISDSKTADSLGLPGTLEALVRRDDLVETLGLDDPDDQELAKTILNAQSARGNRLINRKVNSLAIGIANLANIFNPQVVLLAGFLEPLYEVNDYALLKQIRRYAVAGAREHVQVRTAKLGARILEIGCAQLVFNDFLEDPLGALKS